MLFKLEDEKGAKVKGLFHPSKLKLVNAEKMKDGHDSPSQKEKCRDSNIR